MRLKYEPTSEPLHIYVKWLFLPLEGLVTCCLSLGRQQMEERKRKRALSPETLRKQASALLLHLLYYSPAWS